MNADDLSQDQTRQLFDQVQPMLTYLASCEQRMRQRKFPPDDKLLGLVVAARAAIYDLRQDLHYRSASGVMRQRPSRNH
jgi:hypothetical protein